MVSIFSAISDFCKKMKLPVVAGNISLYNQFDGKNIKPVPSIMMAGIIDDASRAITVNFKEEGNLIYVIGSESSNLGGSHFLKYLGKQGRAIPSFDVEELSRIAKAYLSAAKSGFILSAHDVSSGGLIQTLMEMSFGSNIGFDVDLSNLSGARYIEKLFSEGGQRIVVEVGTSDKRGFEDLMRGVAFRQIGRTIKERISISDQEMLLLDGKVDEFRERWVTGLDGII
jgi:phosphoribosylformylglycinamidine synthase